MKTVGKLFVVELPAVEKNVKSIDVDVKKVPNSGSGGVGYHVFYSSSTSPSDPFSWKWAKYCVMPSAVDANSRHTCTHSFTNPVNVGYIMVGRADYGAAAPTPYVVDIRVST